MRRRIDQAQTPVMSLKSTTEKSTTVEAPTGSQGC